MAKAKKSKSAAPAPAKVGATPASVPGTVQYTDGEGATHEAFVNRRHGEVFDLAYFVNGAKCLVHSVSQGTGPGTWQVEPLE
jgi:hypothetical protein